MIFGLVVSGGRKRRGVNVSATGGHVIAYRIDGVDLAVQVEQSADDVGVAVGSRNVEERLLAEEEERVGVGSVRDVR